jgi:hypothetical protein
MGLPLLVAFVSVNGTCMHVCVIFISTTSSRALNVIYFTGIRRKIVLQTVLHFILLVLTFFYLRGKFITLLDLWNFLMSTHPMKFLVFLS